MKERTVGFYEVVTVKDGEGMRMPQPLDWDATLVSFCPPAVLQMEAVRGTLPRGVERPAIAGPLFGT
ncbi:hypothetical protein AC230_10905 [Streptomyces caatingaensis]|uniref:Uncharacterized protein n=1 Tax=Streptomyces caatingaensis TaxID=1678637 RepID=A0A0K9XGT1_9ACTN|nr:hypothetical protein AC230_10905 [Streptomyces caatingaensis]